MKLFLKTISGIFFVGYLYAMPANSNPIIFTQPDNTTFTGYVKGDEWQHWYETPDGYTFSKDEYGNWVYVRAFSKGKYEYTDIPVADGLHPRVFSDISKHIKPERKFPGPLENVPNLNDISRTEFKIPMLLVEFFDLEASIDIQNFDDMMNMENYESSQGVTGSFNDYYQEISYGEFDPMTMVSGWYMAAESYTVYGSGAPNGWDKVREMIRDAVDESCDAGMDWSVYDNDGNGSVDALNVVHAGVGAEEGGNEIYIWSHSWQLGPYATSCNGVTINNYVIQPERTNMSGGGMVHIGVFAHEFGHALGLPDLYDTDYSSPGIGNWGLMSGGSWGGDGGSPWYPVHMVAWGKYKLGWVDPVIVDEPIITHIFENVEENPVIYKMDGIGDEDEYFLFENRQKLLYDQNLPYHGLLIWHIDDNLSGNSNDWHRRVDLEQADGYYHLNTNGNSGDPGDPYPGYSGNTTFAFDAEPNSIYYNGDPSGISVVDIGVEDGLVSATFRNIPTLSTGEFTITEVSGDGDAIINPGETGDISIELFNPSNDPVMNLIGIPSTNDEFISVNTFEVSFPDLDPLGSSQMNELIEIVVSPGAPLGAHSIELYVYGDLEEGYFEQTLHIGFDVTIIQAGFPLDLGNEVISSPAIVEFEYGGNGYALLYCDNNGLVNLIANDGSSIWDSPFDIGNEIWGAPAVADIDNDTEPEFVITSKSKELFVLDIFGNQESYFDAGQFLTATPAIGNVDEDSELEIVFGSMSSSGKVFALNHDGTTVDGFPVQLNEKIWVGASLVDLEGDGMEEIIVGTDSGNLYVINHDGSVQAGFPIDTGSNIRSAPSTGIFNDGNEIMFFFGNDAGEFYGISSTGDISFIVNTGEIIRSSPSLVEDGENTYIFFTTENNTIHAVDVNGFYLPGWPINTGQELKSSCTFSDLDGNESPEVIVAARNGNLLVYKLNGDSYDQFPLNLERTIENTPLTGDIDGDGDLEIITGESLGISVIDVKSSGLVSPWNMFRGNPLRYGTFYAVNTELCENPESGDLNCDDSSDILDIVILVDFILEEALPSGQEFFSADLNGDGALDILDVILIVNSILDS